MEMKKENQVSVSVLVLVAGLLSQNLVGPVMSTSFQDQKNYYGTPDPHTGGSPPGGSYGTPTHRTPPSPGSGGHGTTPSHGSGGYGTTPPSHGSGGSYNPTPSTPPSRNCGTPPHTPIPTPSNPPPSSGGGGGGGYYLSPPTSGGGTPPTPSIVSPPTTPIIDPGTPSTPVPPFLPAPSSPFIGTFNYWINHPGVIWGLLGWWGTLGSAFGGTFPVAGASLSLPEALSNTRTDGFGALYREGTASLLNSMVNTKFPFTTKQVRDRFVAALGSNKAAVSQAHVFKLANEGLLKPRA